MVNALEMKHCYGNFIQNSLPNELKKSFVHIYLVFIVTLTLFLMFSN